MPLLRRVAALLMLSGAGIVLLAPLAARSAVEVAPPAVEHLLDAAPAAVGDIPRGRLAVRVDPLVPAAGESVELLEASPLPTPGSAPMEATLVPIAAPAPVRPVAAAPSGSVWDQLAECESGGNWAINTGNGYYGGLQFSLGTWQDYGGGEFAAYPHQATREQQITVAERLRAARGYAPWPACRAELGLP